MREQNRRFFVLLGTLVLLSGSWGCSKRGAQEQTEGERAQASPAQDLEGEKGSASKKVTFVEIGSVKCIPCKMMQPIMKEVEKEYGQQVEVVFHDVWTPEGEPYAQKYRIRVIPTQVFLDKNGKEYFRHEGFFPKEELVEVLKKQGVK